MDEKLLQRYIEGNVTAEEIEIVVNWLDADDANVHEFMALHKLYDISILNRPDSMNPATKKIKIPFRKITYELVKIAAIFLLGWLSMIFFTNKQEQEPETPIAYQTLFVPPGQRAELTLPDSSKVWLNAKTKLIYPTNFEKGDRMVTLDGEAYFDVAHNEKQPFIVRTEKMDINVLGTEFNIIAYSGYPMFEVSLLKGSVNIDMYGIPQNHLMQINERIRLRDGKLYQSVIHDFDYFKWKEGLICFNNEPVGNIIEKLQLYFDITIDVKRNGLLNERYTGKFRTKDGVEQVIKVLQLEHKFTYTKDNELNLITIK